MELLLHANEMFGQINQMDCSLKWLMTWSPPFPWMKRQKTYSIGLAASGSAWPVATPMTSESSVLASQNLLV